MGGVAVITINVLIGLTSVSQDYGLDHSRSEPCMILRTVISLSEDSPGFQTCSACLCSLVLIPVT